MFFGPGNLTVSQVFLETLSNNNCLFQKELLTCAAESNNSFDEIEYKI